jgi:hypothetical protein
MHSPFQSALLRRLSVLIVSCTSAVIAQSSPAVSNLTCNPSTVNAGTSTVCTVLLTTVAPAGGAIVGISRNSTSVAVPSTITIPQNSFSTTFSASVSATAVSHSVIVTASYGGTSKSASLSVVSTIPQLVNFACAPATVSSGGSAVCTLALSLPAPSTGATVTLSSSSVNVTVPGRVTIPAGAMSTSLPAVVSPSAPAGLVAITGIYGALSKRVTLTVASTAAAPATPQLSGLTCAPASLIAGASSTCTVSLSSAAPAGGMGITVSKTGTGITTPAGVTVAAGATLAQFAVATASSTPAQTTVISAAANGVTKSASIVIAAATATPQLSGLTCAPASITAGGSALCTVTLSSVAPPSGIAVSVSTSGTGVTVPASVTIPANVASASFSAATTAATTAQTATITAKLGTATKSALLSIGAGSSYRITSFSCTPTTIIPDQSARCLVYLSAEAPAGGLIASLKSSSSSITVPSTVNIPERASIFQFYAEGASNAVNVETATLTATVQQQSATTTLTINPNPPFYLRGNTTEISSLANGAPVYPTAVPATLVGRLGVRGNGYISFGSVVGSSGIEFRAGGSQTTNTSFINFVGQDLGTFFDAQGEVSFFLKSAYTFAERQSLPSPNHRFIFEAHDGSANQFGFLTYTSGGVLTFAYTTRGVTTLYTVPAGQEDRIFGRDVTAKIRFTWSASSSELYVNDILVRTSTFMPIPGKWGSASTMTIGAHTTLASPGGNYASDDGIAEFKVR